MSRIDEMVNRFLAWKLPDDFHPDGGVKFERPPYPFPAPQWPSGTNLLTAAQAKDMLTHVLGDVLAEAAKSERRAITFGDIVHTQVLAMRAAYVEAKLNGSDAGMTWIENTLEGPGQLPDLAAAKKEGGAQCMFNREMAEHEAFRAAHPAPGA